MTKFPELFSEKIHNEYLLIILLGEIYVFRSIYFSNEISTCKSLQTSFCISFFFTHLEFITYDTFAFFLLKINSKRIRVVRNDQISRIVF